MLAACYLLLVLAAGAVRCFAISLLLSRRLFLLRSPISEDGESLLAERSFVSKPKLQRNIDAVGDWMNRENENQDFVEVRDATM